MKKKNTYKFQIFHKLHSCTMEDYHKKKLTFIFDIINIACSIILLYVFFVAQNLKNIFRILKKWFFKNYTLMIGVEILSFLPWTTSYFVYSIKQNSNEYQATFRFGKLLLVSRKVKVKKFLTCEKITSRIQKNSKITYQSMQTFQHFNISTSLEIRMNEF